MEQKILELFLYSNTLKFSEIEQGLNTRSNKLAYHLKKLVAQGILTKSSETYALSETAEHLIPYLSEKKSPLPVLLIHIGNTQKAFLIKRTKRPYKDKLSLPGGRILLGESLAQATQRIMQEKYDIKAKLSSLHSLSLEHVRKNGKVIHSFLLIFVSATTSQNLLLTDIQKNKKPIIKSDYLLMKKDLKSTTKIRKIASQI